MDLREVYSGTREALVQLASGLSYDDERRPVPACPGWQVRDVLVHLVGVAEDVATGNLDGAPGAAWTAAHLERRRDAVLADALADWDKYTPAVLERLDAATNPMAYPLALDVVTHRHDVHGTLGLPAPAAAPGATDFDRATTTLAVESFGKMFGRRARDAGLPPVEFADGDWTFRAGAKEGPAQTVRVSRVELFRALTGRRSGAQVRAWDWPVDPAPYFDFFSPFGPLPQADVVEPLVP